MKNKRSHHMTSKDEVSKRDHQHHGADFVPEVTPPPLIPLNEGITKKRNRVLDIHFDRSKSAQFNDNRIRASEVISLDETKTMSNNEVLETLQKKDIDGIDLPKGLGPKHYVNLDRETKDYVQKGFFLDSGAYNRHQGLTSQSVFNEGKWRRHSDLRDFNEGLLIETLSEAKEVEEFTGGIILAVEWDPKINQVIRITDLETARKEKFKNRYYVIYVSNDSKEHKLITDSQLDYLKDLADERNEATTDVELSKALDKTDEFVYGGGIAEDDQADAATIVKHLRDEPVEHNLSNVQEEILLDLEIDVIQSRHDYDEDRNDNDFYDLEDSIELRDDFRKAVIKTEDDVRDANRVNKIATKRKADIQKADKRR